MVFFCANRDAFHTHGVDVHLANTAPQGWGTTETAESSVVSSCSFMEEGSENETYIFNSFHTHRHLLLSINDTMNPGDFSCVYLFHLSPEDKTKVIFYLTRNKLERSLNAIVGSDMERGCMLWRCWKMKENKVKKNKQTSIWKRFIPEIAHLPGIRRREPNPATVHWARPCEPRLIRSQILGCLGSPSRYTPPRTDRWGSSCGMLVSEIVYRNLNTLGMGRGGQEDVLGVPNDHSRTSYILDDIP